jgi:outer membrane protein TolC
VKEFASLDARVALNALNQATSAWEASKGTAEQASKAYTIAEVRYKEGISTQLELNDSRILLEQSNANRALAARNLQIARMKLALLANLPLSSGTSAQSAQSTQQSAVRSQQSASTGSQQSAATQTQQTSATQTTPSGFQNP